MSTPNLIAREPLKRFRHRLTGSLTEPEENGYDQQRTPWLQVVDQFPAAIVNAANTQDVVETVRFAREMGVDLAVQNTGHGIARPCNGGVLLRLSGMKGIQVRPDDGTATVEPGVLSGELLKEAEPHGLAYASGQVSNVGVMGYTLGGGTGWLGRKVGAACHAVQSATVVLADGSVVTASAAENPDLFRALRGGGGNFGVVTALTVRLVRVRKVFGGMAYYRIKDAPEVIRFYREWTATLSDDTSTVLRLMKIPPKPRFLLHLLTETCAIGVCHAEERTADRLHDQITRFKSPVIDQLEVRPYLEMSDFDEASDLAGSPTYQHLESLKDLSDPVVDGLVDIARTRIPPLMMVELQHLTGALGREPAEPAAYTEPTAPYFLHIVSPAIDSSLAELATATREAFDSLGPVYTGQACYNFLRGDEQDRVPAAFGPDQYARLQALKKKYDPSNLFRLNLNIPPGN